MSNSAISHNTFVIERTYPKSAQAVFAAFALVEKKKRWFAGGDAYEVLSYELDFSLGGHEVLVGKFKPGTPIAGSVLKWSQRFEDIVEGERIVFSQTLDKNDERISCSLVTIELRPQELSCLLVLTHQGVYFEGADGPQMRQMGWRALLDSVLGVLG